jgi:hypothetical protein
MPKGLTPGVLSFIGSGADELIGGYLNFFSEKIIPISEMAPEL